MGQNEPYAVECEELERSFGSVLAVNHVTFNVRPREVFALLGPNGAGKTTLLRILVTLLSADSGLARVFGLDTRRDKMAIRRLVGYVPQHLSADPSLTGRENVWLFARLFDVPRRHRPSRVNDALAVMGLEEVASRLVATYSGGMVRRLELAQALVARPRLLILDEPTIGLDPVARSSLWKRVVTLRDHLGLTILLTTHYMEEADQLCDRIAMMHRGRLRAIDTPAELKARVSPNATLDDVFRYFTPFTGELLDEEGRVRDVRSVRRTARRLS